MLHAYFMTSCDIGSAKEVVSELQKIKAVQDVSMVNGIYSIVVKTSSRNENDLERTNMQIREINKVLSTMTLIVSMSY